MRLCCTANASSAGKTNDKKWGGEIGILKNTEGKPANLNIMSLKEAWNTPYMKNTRRQMLNGDIPAACSKCFKEEKAGHRSKRNWENEYWWNQVDVDQIIKETQSDGEIPPKITYIDLRLGTKCNLKCIMCSPHDSSLWVSDWNKLYPKIENPSLKELMVWHNKGQVDGASYNWHQNNEAFWNEFYKQIPNMKQLYFAGGESTIIEEHYGLLQKCVDMGHSKDIELRYNSNGIEMPDRLFKLWHQFRRVRFHFSIDSVGPMNDYIRYPSRWSQIEKKLRKLDHTSEHIEVTIACAVQVLNMYYIPDFIKWKLEQNYKNINSWPLGAGLINYHFVYHPSHLNVKVFPPWFKKTIRDKYEDFYLWLMKNHRSDEDFLNHNYGIKRLKGMVSFMESEDWSNRMSEFKEYINLLDNIRGTSFTKTFPEMETLISTL